MAEAKENLAFMEHVRVKKQSRDDRMQLKANMLSISSLFQTEWIVNSGQFIHSWNKHQVSFE